MTKGKVWEKKIWWILLGVLCVVIVGLGVGVAVINIQSSHDETIDNGDSSDYISGNEGGEEYEYSYVYDDARVIMDDGGADSLLRLTEYFDGLDATAENEEVAVIYNIARMDILSEYGFYDEVINYANAVGIEGKEMSILQRITVLTFYSSAYGNIGDTEKKTEYEEKLAFYMNEYNDELKDEQDEGN